MTKFIDIFVNNLLLTILMLAALINHQNIPFDLDQLKSRKKNQTASNVQDIILIIFNSLDFRKFFKLILKFMAAKCPITAKARIYIIYSLFFLFFSSF
jgi:hypothetical protein